MGCSYDFFSAIVPSENTAKKFVEIFMDVLKDELYCSKSPCYISSKGNGNYEIEIDEYPLFKEMCQGSQLNKFVFAYLKAVPNIPSTPSIVELMTTVAHGILLNTIITTENWTLWKLIQKVNLRVTV